MIDLLPHVLAQRPDFRLVLVGEGPRLEPARAMARWMNLERSVEFAGAVAPEEVPVWIAAADLALYWPDYPVKSSGFLGDSIKFYEYMALAKPIVTIRRPNSAEPVVRADAGVLTEPNPQAFAQGILSLLNERSGMIEMGRRGAEEVRQRHTWEAVARGIATVCGVDPEDEPGDSPPS